MRNTWMCAVAAGALAVLSGCGGGDSEEEAGEQVVVPAGPMDKYLGLYSQCDQKHTRSTLMVTKAEGGTYGFEPKEVTYQNADCTGNVLGTWSWGAPASVRYLSTDVVTVRGDQLPASLTIDKFEVSSVKVQPRLEGPAVTNSACIVHSGGQVCYDLDERNRVGEAGLYLSGATLHFFEPDKGIWLEEGTYAKEN